MFDGKSDPDAEVVDEVYARTGAIIVGKRMFDVGVGPWGDARASTCRSSSSPTRRGSRSSSRAEPRTHS